MCPFNNNNKKYEIKTNKSEAVENTDSFDGIVNSTQAKR